MVRAEIKCGVLAAVSICLVATGCASEALTRMGDDLELQFQQKGAEIEHAINKVGEALTGSATRAQDKAEKFYDRLVNKYEKHHKPSKLVFFLDDAEAPARPTTAETAAARGAEGRPVVVAPEEIKSEFLGERMLEHRGLRLLWKLALDGSGARHADVNNGYLYVVTKLNRMYSIELKTGLTRWITDLGARPDGPPGFNDIYVVISAGDVVRVIDKRVGKDKWKFETKVQPSSRPYCTSFYFVFGCWTGKACGFKFGERHPAWQFKAGNHVFAAPYLFGIHAFAATDNGLCVKYNTAAELGSGETNFGGRPVGDLVGSKDLMFIGTENYEMVAIRAATGDKAWTHGCGGRVVGGPWLSQTENVLYYSAHDDGLYALTAITGKARWKVPRGVKPVALSGAYLFVLRDDGTVSKVDNGTGKVIWSESVEPFVSVVGHMQNEVMYLISADGQVFAVAPKK